MNITENDLAVASSFYPVLVECAREPGNARVTYGELVERAKRRFPNLEAVQSTIPVSAGRKLDVVRMFLTEQGLPDLTSLVVNRATGEVGVGYHANPEEVRKQVAAYDWNAVSEEFNLHVEKLRKQIVASPRPKLRRPEAVRLMSAYYQENRATLPKSIVHHREEIVELLRNGVPVEVAFQQQVTATAAHT